MTVRAAVPFQSRLKRWLASQVRRRVPQLTRDARVELVEHIQSNSQWNFDFVLLIALSALIASLGLLDNSAAVIIGAMLVAPLMTPLLGLGLAIAQGNSRLTGMALKTAFLGFVTVFILAFAVGMMASDFYEATEEMNSRNWPQILDLVVAYVSGLAAAYASGRPRLLAALPGVAIAAALVPPVATSGLALSIGDYDVVFGALLLFGVNVLAIILASAITLRSMGIIRLGKDLNLARILGKALIVISIAITLYLAVSPPHLAPDKELVEAVESALPPEYRLRDITIRRDFKGVKLQVDLGGTKLPDDSLQQALRDIAHDYLNQDAHLRLTCRFETLVR
jgi:uncharacterized hydrophobic protein (TIGR00271 family)